MSKKVRTRKRLVSRLVGLGVDPAEALTITRIGQDPPAREGPRPARWLRSPPHENKLNSCYWCGRFYDGPGEYCSKDCYHDYHVRTQRGATAMVGRRDRGKCAICGLNTGGLAHALARGIKIRHALQASGGGLSAEAVTEDLIRRWSQVVRYEKSRERLWDIDHIIPVREGGGCCGLENLRTLCVVCHRAHEAGFGESQREAARESRRRRDETVRARIKEAAEARRQQANVPEYEWS